MSNTSAENNVIHDGVMANTPFEKDMRILARNICCYKHMISLQSRQSVSVRPVIRILGKSITS